MNMRKLESLEIQLTVTCVGCQNERIFVRNFTNTTSIMNQSGEDEFFHFVITTIGFLSNHDQNSAKNRQHYRCRICGYLAAGFFIITTTATAADQTNTNKVQFSSVHISFDFIELVVIDFYLIFLANLNSNLLFSSLCICIIFRKCFILVFAFFGSPYTFDCCYVIFGYICLLNYDTDRIHIWNERK